MVTKWSSYLSILTHNDLNICDNGQGIFFINETICSSSEDDVRNKFSFLIDTMMLSDWYCNCEMIVLKIRSNVFICQNYIHTDYSVLGILSPL